MTDLEPLKKKPWRWGGEKPPEDAAAPEQYERFHAWRLKNGYTRVDLAKLTGFSASTIADLETGIVRGSRVRPVPMAAQRRYRLCLAAIAHGLENWNFGE
jgi:DNA-binding XRE family transcriptional regulator